MVTITKYDNGDIVWLIYGNIPAEAVIEHISVESGSQGDYIEYKLDVTGQVGSMWAQENCLFSTREELIKSL